MDFCIANPYNYKTETIRVNDVPDMPGFPEEFTQQIKEKNEKMKEVIKQASELYKYIYADDVVLDGNNNRNKNLIVLIILHNASAQSVSNRYCFKSAVNKPMQIHTKVHRAL
jgi:hypothetical protein